MNENRVLNHVIRTPDLFCNFDLNKLKGNSPRGQNNIKKFYKCADKRSLAERIFTRYLHMLLLHLIEGDRTFVFPYRYYADLHFRVVPEERIKRNLEVGCLQDIDFLQSNFKYYELVMSWKVGERMTHEYVKLSKNFTQLIHDKINTGFVYA